tara:strand:+ start:3407 stop:4492 length:1086 start_codon:yes stop_codon:yes gene_type:complete
MTNNTKKISSNLASKKINTVLKGLTQYVVDAMDQAIEEAQIPPIEVPVYQEGKHTITIDGHVNPQIQKIATVMQLGIPVCLFGGSGTGKTTLAKQASEILNLPFYCQTVTSGMPESALLGRHKLTADGGMEYIDTPFLKAVEEGGVFLLDEFDAIDENCALAINNLLEFGYLNLPMRDEKPVVQAHPNFKFIACANTKLNGASLIHNGRNQLDGATISRFDGGIFEIDYDLYLEKLLCPDVHIRSLFQAVRMIVEQNDIRKEISTRTLKRAQMVWSTGQFKTPEELLNHFMINWSLQEKEVIRELLPEDLTLAMKKAILSEEETEELQAQYDVEESNSASSKKDVAEFLKTIKNVGAEEIE